VQTHRLMAGLIVFSAACSPVTDETPGSVYRVTDSSVTIIGPYAKKSMDHLYTPHDVAQPTAAMTAQAREVCPNARFVSASPSTVDFDNLLYLFRC
jgi:hypothetical protein